MNTWPDGRRKAISQAEHEVWNTEHYPGTRQLCSECNEPTGRCEEDTLRSVDNEPLCKECWEAEQLDLDTACSDFLEKGDRE